MHFDASSRPEDSILCSIVDGIEHKSLGLGAC
jgi:hypothetical protein